MKFVLLSLVLLSAWRWRRIQRKMDVKILALTGEK